MSILEDRRAEFERRFTLDQEVLFRIGLRKARHAGVWTGQQLGMTDEEALQCGRELSDWAFDHPGDEALNRRVAFLLARSGIVPDPAHILAALKRAEKQARQEIMDGE